LNGRPSWAPQQEVVAVTEPPDKDHDHGDDDIRGLLTEALHTNSPDPAALQRLRDAASREWVLAIDSPRRSTAWKKQAVALAAALAILVIGAAWYVWPVSSPHAFGVVARVEAGGGEIAKNALQRRPLKAGLTLNVGEELVTHGPVLIALASGGTLRVAPDTVLELTSPSESELQRGLIYLDWPPGHAAAAPFGVSTRAGLVQHVGTEFEVLSNDQIVRIRVREGQVQLRSASQQTLIDAGTQLTANRDGSVIQSPIASYGRDWLWVTALAPDYEIEGQPLVNFLQWAARELGRPLKFADDHAREVAEHTILHGSIKGREPLDALGSVLSTTSLTYEIRGDTIWVQSGRGI
jgi:hypothetical protein